jgi:hypothetical protein
MKKIIFIIFLLVILLFVGRLTFSKQKVSMVVKTTLQSQGVPLPTVQDTIRTFYNLVGEKRIDDAVNMLDGMENNEDTIRQGWGVYLNSFDKVIIKSIDKEGDAYRVVLDLKMKPESATSTIPYFGYNDGLNTRWITVNKDAKGLYKIVGIATGP